MEIIDNAPLIRVEKVNNIISGNSKSVQVAGTNGKGSTCAFLSSILQAHGKKVGLYTSPHVMDICERISINGENIAYEEFEHLVKSLDDAQKGMCKSDLMFFSAVMYFNKHNVDYAVYETGLGGRNDSATLINHECGIITQIGLDHTDLLGDTIEKITAEKAAVIKRGMKMFVYPNSTNGIIKQTCEDVGADFVDIIEGDFNEHDDGFSYDGFGLHIGSVKLSLKGSFQKYNCVCAMLCAKELLGDEFDVVKSIVAVEDVNVFGRMSILKDNPLIIADVSHNPDGIRELCDYVSKLEGSKCAIVSIQKTKDHISMMEALKKEFDFIIAAKADDTAHNVDELGGDLCVPTVEAAYAKAREFNFDVIVFCGSFAVVRCAAEIFDKNM